MQLTISSATLTTRKHSWNPLNLPDGAASTTTIIIKCCLLCRPLPMLMTATCLSRCPAAAKAQHE